MNRNMKTATLLFAVWIASLTVAYAVTEYYWSPVVQVAPKNVVASLTRDKAIAEPGETVTFSGYVTKNGVPLLGITVYLWNSTDPALGWTDTTLSDVTDAAGFYTIAYVYPITNMVQNYKVGIDKATIP